jgi:ribosomal protein S18 acetylase RimI-like enzyme
VADTFDAITSTRLYRQAGYYQIGERPGYYADGMTALALRKDFAA